MNCTVGIVNWNGKGYLRSCIERVLVQKISNFDFSIVIFDNNSTDDSLGEILDLIGDRVKVIHSDRNLGFARGHNRIIASIETDFYMPLNFDVFLEPNYMREILSAMREDATIGMATGKLLKMMNFKPQPLLDSTGIEMAYYMPHPRGELERDEGQYDTPDCRFIFGPCGAAPIYRIKMLENIRFKNEYFDEDFVNYVEDVDLAWRAQLRGWKGIYVKEAVAFHERGATRKNNASERQAYFVRGYRNRYLTLYKNVTADEIRTHGIKFFSRELVFLLSLYDGGADPVIKFRALFSALRSLNRVRIKRKHVQSAINTDMKSLIPGFCYANFSVLQYLLSELILLRLRIASGGYTIIKRIFRVKK